MSENYDQSVNMELVYNETSNFGRFDVEKAVVMIWVFKILLRFFPPLNSIFHIYLLSV